ncbi:helix-turn-helix domain-containing protein [Aetokthonos hydrillicola Thurmond2011]|uniref:Helix-turn-helix domain-containing protein n=1 Tax=Aetokthonos hydrillicola Thurmond2011 TaxID=2712845 RepID=A0AAP5MBP9_9CYAN|nr:helix-turn-helix domain-containing protein [Aetokthonos hydrillicola]MBW4585140.1 helix-turn-helix domain-containing protein [Aetokthonos hydrillicola CCALA 1050]MDR9899480.1 helix-turn-helix domain-containing protein [Aetokthonos hydrillicola Thurmond2011]
MIVWRLSRLMAERRVSGKQLAEILHVHPNTVSRLRRAFTMPPIDGDLLNKLCQELKCIPSDLIEYIPSEDEIPASKLSTVSEVKNEQNIAELSQSIAEAIQATTSSGKTSITSQEILARVTALLAVTPQTNF